MKIYETKEIKNIALLGSKGSENHTRRVDALRVWSHKNVAEQSKAATPFPTIFR